GAICDSGAVVPAVRAAIRKMIAWAITTIADRNAMPNHALPASIASWMSPASALRARAQVDRGSRGRARATNTTPTAAATIAIATHGIAERTGDGRTRRTTMVTTA